ncbi:MAG: hypothetical protein EGQ71_00230 [Dialister sp.]|nr:hypothetical protein [Dialister sp.]
MIVSRGCRRLYDRREKRKKAIKKHHGADHVMLSFWWAITGSNWFRSEHHLKERSDAQMIVSRGCRRLNDRREKRKKARKKTAWSESHEAFFLVGDNRIELVPQRTSFEGAKRRANDRERGCRRLNDNEKKGKEEKRPHGTKHVKSFHYGGR